MREVCASSRPVFFLGRTGAGVNGHELPEIVAAASHVLAVGQKGDGTGRGVPQVLRQGITTLGKPIGDPVKDWPGNAYAGYQRREPVIDVEQFRLSLGKQMTGTVSLKETGYHLAALGIDDRYQSRDFGGTRPSEGLVRVDPQNLGSDGIGKGLGCGDADPQAGEGPGAGGDGNKLDILWRPADLSKSLPDGWSK